MDGEDLVEDVSVMVEVVAEGRLWRCMLIL
jgi:hypothetical protein